MLTLLSRELDTMLTFAIVGMMTMTMTMLIVPQVATIARDTPLPRLCRERHHERPQRLSVAGLGDMRDIDGRKCGPGTATLAV